jgi:hypothetical protein
MRTSPRFLLSLYAVIPLALAAIAVDALLLGHRLRDSLPSSPEKLQFFTVFFVLPHIVASFVLYADSDYLRRYRTRLSVGLVAVTAAVFLGTLLVGIMNVYYAYAVATVYHVLAQQLGITRAMVQRTGRSYSAWKWTALTFGIVVYVDLIAPELLPELLGWPRTGVAALSTALFCVTAALVLQVARRASSARGRHYAWATQALLGAMGLSSLAGYPFFVLLMPRVIHDATAFAFYVPHDVNRNRSTRHNRVYRALSFLPLPVAAIGPLLAIAVAFPLQQWSAASLLGYQTVICLALMHYFVESFGWRRDSEARRSIRFD